MNYWTLLQIWAIILIIGIIVWKHKWREIFIDELKETIDYVERINRIKDRWMESRIRLYAMRIKHRYPIHLEWWEKIFAWLIVRKVTNTVANLITIIRILLAIIIALLLVLQYNTEGVTALILNITSIFLYVIACLLDLLDGPTARALNQISNVGKWLDPLADKILLGSALILGYRYLEAWIFFAVVGQESFLLIISAIKMMLKKLPITMATQAGRAGKIKAIFEFLGGGFLFLCPLGDIGGIIVGGLFIMIGAGLLRFRPLGGKAELIVGGLFILIGGGFLGLYSLGGTVKMITDGLFIVSIPLAIASIIGYLASVKWAKQPLTALTKVEL